MNASVAGATALLTALNFPPAQQNDRSALVLLALLELTPGDSWADAVNPMRGTHALMGWIRTAWNVDYAANSRETIRRQTLHQFIAAGLVAYNADDAARAVNSSLNNYRVTNEALALIHAFETDHFANQLIEYLVSAPGLATKYAAARQLERIPVTLPDGSAITLSGGGQNVLLKTMVEDFCAIFTPGAQVIYIGDADEKLAKFDADVLSALGVVVEQHGKLPDLVVYDSARNWLILMEAASSHGPVDGKRHAELAKIFGDSSAGLVYVSAFPDRATMRKYLNVLAWETEAWAADEPTHLVHFNGSKFLGPYSD